MASNTVSIRVVGDSKDLQRAFKTAEQSSKSFSDKFKNDSQILTRWAANGAKAIGAIGAAVVGISLKGGIDRLMGLERANKQLGQLGVEGKAAEGLMDSLLQTLLGTPFALDKGAASLAGFVSSGQDLKDIPQLIQQVTDAAAFGNLTLEEVDFIWQRIGTTGRVTNEELRMLAERNIPVYTQLAAAFGTTAAEVFDMASNGELSADMFFDAWEKAADGSIEGSVRIAGAALAMGETTEGAWANMRTAMSRFGATLLEEVFPLAKDVFSAIGEGFDRMGEVMGEAFGGLDTSGIEDFISRIPDMMESAAESVVTLWQETETLRDVMGTLARGGIELLSNRLVQLGIVAGGVYKTLTLTAAHPLIAGLALLALAIGNTAQKADEARREGEDLANQWSDMTDIARELALIELFGPEQVAVLEDAGIQLSDIADGTLSYRDALNLLNDERSNFLGLSDPTDIAGQRTITTLKGLAEGEEEYAEKTRLAAEATAEAHGEMQTTLPIQDNLTTSTENLTGAEGDLEDAIGDANVEIKTQNELLSDALDRINDLISPAFSYITAQNDLAEAQAAYNAAVEEFGENSPEAIAAAEDIAEANMGIQEAVVAIGEEGVPAAMEALASMGVPQSVIDKFAEDKKRIEELFRNMVLRIGVTAPTLFPTSPSGGGVGWRSDSKTYYHAGGIVQGPPGADVPIIAQAGEEIIPRSEVNGRSKGDIYLTVNAGLGTNGHTVGEQIVEEIIKARRRGVKV